MATFLKMATSTVYKMAGLGSFQGSHTYKVSTSFIIIFTWTRINGSEKKMHLVDKFEPVIAAFKD